MINMGAITNAYNADEAVVMAFKAGNDMILALINIDSAVNEIVEKVAKNEIDEEQIDNRVKRIIMKKLQLAVG